MGDILEDSPVAVDPARDQWQRTIRVETLTVQAPSNTVKAEALSVFLGSRCLLKDTELKIPEVARSIERPQLAGPPRLVQSGTTYGLVGPNGCGKSTLLRVIAEGLVPTPASWDVMLVGQHLPPAQCRTAAEEVLSSSMQLTELLRQQATAEVELSSLSSESREADTDAFLQANSRLTEVQRQLSMWHGATEEVEKHLVALGFHRGSADSKGGTCSSTWGAQSRCRPAVNSSMQHLSGGWRMKVELAKALWLKPKLLLLDEPTNHLDFEALQWLEEQLDAYPHTVMVVSHDVSFLHASCQDIFWLQEGRLESLPVDAVSQEDIARMQRRKGLEFNFAVPGGGNLQHHGVSLHGAKFSHPPTEGGAAGLQLHVKGNIRFSTSSRAVVLGRNGSGKSTFLDLCAGALRPTGGSVDHTPDCQVGHYTQQMDQLDEHADSSAVEFLVSTCLEELQARLGCKATAAAKAAERRGDKPRVGAALGKRLKEVARAVLSNFGFEGDLAVSVPVGSLSGGQKARLKLAALSLHPAHVLFLDEPTNHLDAEACEALASGLSEYKGGVVVVTHDDDLIYRLIQCNWAESQLVTSQGGTISCKREFAGHCLKALKEQVRRSENEDAVAERRPTDTRDTATLTPQVPTGKAGTLPPWLASARAARRGRRDKAQDVVHVVPEAALAASTDALCTQSDPPRVACVVEARQASEPSQPAIFGGSDFDKYRNTWDALLQRDLANLEKAVAKWLIHEEIGVLTRAKLMEKIRVSAAVRRLMEEEGDSFQQEAFARWALQHAASNKATGHKGGA